MATRTLAFEIGTEELPAFALHDATQQLKTLVAGDAAKAKMTAVPFAFESAQVYSTPRRIITVFQGVPEEIPAFDEEFRGPSTRIAFDAEGNATKAAAGFARGKGVAVEDLVRRTEGNEEYVYAVRHVEARQVADLLPGFFAKVLTDIAWPKAQRWGSHNETFSRPVRWLVALFGEDVVELEYAGIEAGRETRGHRFLAPGPFALASADELLPCITAHFVVPTEEEREASIREQAARIAANLDLDVDLPAKTMAEVVNLCEYPTLMVGTFDEKFLEVPKEITVDAMLVHQRYFPLFYKDGRLANKFLITSNGDPKFEANIIDGNQRVVAARLYDAKFFYDEDRKIPLEDYVEKLSQVTFQEALGTVLQKTERVAAQAADLAFAAGLNALEVADAKRAATLCKADLVTGAVVEFTSVQGIMGSYYAKASGENDTVAQAIADHYRPRFSGDDLPESNVGKIVAIADKLDTICGLFAVGQGPTGSSDPFALRRSAIGILAMLDSGVQVELVGAIDNALELLAAQGIAFDKKKVAAEVLEFFITRGKVALRDAGYGQDTIDAVLSAGVVEPMELYARVRALDAARANDAETFEDLAIAFGRANNLRDAAAGTAYDASLFIPVEAELAEAVEAAFAKVDGALANNDYAAALACLAGLRGPIDAFFAGVKVVDDDAAIRKNRMALLNAFVAVFANVADFGKMVKA